MAKNDPPIPLSVVMPVYNEEEAIPLAVEDVQRDVLDHVTGAELVVVNDGSRDGTGAILDGLGAKDARIHVIHQQNRGHGGALMAALDAARGEHVFLIDSDRQIPLSEFGAAWAQIQAGRQGVFGVRRRRHDPALRLYLSAFVRRSIHVMFGTRIVDANVPYKLLKRTIWLDAQPCIPAGTLAPSLFLAIFAKRRGYDIVELDVIHKERDTGEVSIRRFKLLKFCARAFQQMVAFRRCVRGVGPRPSSPASVPSRT
jgi:glycosyltransferase involved in cell wall biosynthesis